MKKDLPIFLTKNNFQIFCFIFFCSFWLIFYPLDPDPDPGSQNLADPTDPDPKHCLREKKVFRFFLSHWSTKKSYKFSKNIEESCTNRVQFCTKRRKSDIFWLTLYYKMSYLQRVLFIQIIYLKWFLFTTWWGHSLFYKSLSETNMSLELSLVLLLISFLCFEPIHLLEEVIDFLSFRRLALSCILNFHLDI